MSKRYVDDGFWTDPYVEKLDPTEKMVFIYLLTNPLCNVAGIYEVSLKRLAYETGLDVSVADTILERFVRDKRILRAENWIILLNFGKHQVLNPSVEAGVRRIWGQLPDWVQTVAGCDSLVYFTLLNLTLPNSTKPNAKRDEQTATSAVAKADEFGKPEINELFDYWQEATGIALVSNRQRNRNAAHNLLNKHGKEKMKRVIDGVALAQQDRFAPRISDFATLQSKWNELMLWGRQASTNSQAKVVVL